MGGSQAQTNLAQNKGEQRSSTRCECWQSQEMGCGEGAVESGDRQLRILVFKATMDDSYDRVSIFTNSHGVAAMVQGSEVANRRLSSVRRLLILASIGITLFAVEHLCAQSPEAEAVPAGHMFGEMQVKQFDVQPIVERLDREAGLNGQEARDWLQQRVRSLFPVQSGEINGVGPSSTSSGNQASSSAVGVQLPSGRLTNVPLDSHGCGVHIEESTLTVVCPKSWLKSIANMLETLNRFGLRQVIIRTYVFQGATEDIQNLSINWSHVEALSHVAQSGEAAVQPAVARPGTGSVTLAGLASLQKVQPAAEPLMPPPGVTSNTWTEATSVIERSTPVLYTVLTPNENQALLKSLKTVESIEKVMSPSVVVFNNQVAEVSNSVERPFVTSIKPMRFGPKGRQQIEFAPNIRIYPEGTTLKLQPELVGGDRVLLNCKLDLCKIRKVETLKLPSHRPGDEAWTIQMPEVASTQFHTRIELPVNHALAVSTFDQDEIGQRRSVLVICQCLVRDMEQTTPPSGQIR